MKLFFLFAFLFSISQFSFSQSEKRIIGKVQCEEFSAQNVEIANSITKKSTTADGNGNFSISAKPGDTLVFISKNYYYKKIGLKQRDFDTNNLVIFLTKKPIELDEVLITKLPNLSLKQHIPSIIGKQYIPDTQTSLKNPSVYDGAIENGMNFMAIGGMIFKLFKKKDVDQKNEGAKTDFKELVIHQCNPSFFTDSLKLKPEEVNLFIEFCEVDPKSKLINENSNVLTIMDFLFAKKEEFKKLPNW